MALGAGSLFWLGGALGSTVQAPAPLSADDVFTLRGTQFYLDGKPYAEMSFNKFDLLWEIWGGIETRNTTGDASALQTGLQKADQALRDLHEMGFRTIRIFGVPFVHDAATLTKAIEPKPLFEAIDTTLDLCDKHGIQVVFSLALGTFAHDGEVPVVPGAPAQPMPFFADPSSPARAHCHAFIDEIVQRYRGRKAIAMWEVTNELTNEADIGVRKGRVSPTLPQVAEFLDEAAQRIKQDDPLRLVSDGGSILRPAAWHRWHEQSWTPDNEDQYRQAYAAYFQHSAIDVIDNHYYELRKGGEQLAPGPDGKPVFVTSADLVKIAHALGKGAILAEYGTLPSAWADGPKKKQPDDPNWFAGYHDPNAAPWVQKGVDDIVRSKASLAYWWTYQSDRPVDQHDNPVVFSRELTPDLMKIIADGNRRLKAAVTGI